MTPRRRRGASCCWPIPQCSNLRFLLPQPQFRILLRARSLCLPLSGLSSSHFLTGWGNPAWPSGYHIITPAPSLCLCCMSIPLPPSLHHSFSPLLFFILVLFAFSLRIKYLSLGPAFHFYLYLLCDFRKMSLPFCKTGIKRASTSEGCCGG